MTQLLLRWTNLISLLSLQKGFESNFIRSLSPVPLWRVQTFAWRPVLRGYLLRGDWRMGHCLRLLVYSSRWGDRSCIIWPNGNNIFLSFKLELHRSDNKVGYEVLIIRLISALQMEIRRTGCKEILCSLLSKSTENFPEEFSCCVLSDYFQELIRSFSHI